jgi:hypothetical protein
MDKNNTLKIFAGRDTYNLKTASVEKMKDIIHKATLADDWNAAVTEEMDRALEETETNQAAVIPILLSAFYTLSPTNCTFTIDGFIPQIQTMFADRELIDPVISYFNSKATGEPTQCEDDKKEFDKETPDFKAFEVTDRNVMLDKFFEFRGCKFSFPVLSLFTHIGIRIAQSPENNKENFCLWPACQPQVNNRPIPMNWMYNYARGEKKENPYLVQAIGKKEGDLGWAGQKVYFLPYKVVHMSKTPNKTQAPMFHVISDSVSGGPDDVGVISESVTSGPENAPKKPELFAEDKDEPRFDGGLYAGISSFKVAVKAFDALSVCPKLL